MMLFNCISYVTSNGSIVANDKLERIWKEANTVCFKVLTQHLPGKNDENYNKTSVVIANLWL